ncbi:MAG: GTP-binding protein, partial [Patescibacteria group bacterium]|nr:GTP-binding protein [Patescibacteria group bacterium]
MNIRNFCIIAHIDHGKSTLADRFLEITGTMSEREMTHSQILDTMDLEQERGITIKLQPARMIWHAPDANPELNELNQKIAIKRSRRFILNLIDTPGHVDFQYEVSRSLAACEGAVLVVDASQGIEAQTLSNVHLAIEQGLEIIPVINKIDLSVADPDKVEREMIDLFGFKKSEILRCSAKTGAGVSEILDAICEKVPDPSLNTSYKQYAKTKTDLNKSTALALIFDSFYDSYQGVIALVRVFNGRFNDHEKVLFCGTKKELETTELGYLLPARSKQQLLDVGEVGYLVTGAKDIHDVRVGDTITSARNPGLALPGYKKVTPMVYAGLFTIDSSEYENLRDALDKLSLNDASLSFEPESSQALGFGFRVGFLGLLHMEIVQERLEREYDLELIA